MTTATVKVVAHLTARPDKIEETRAALLELIQPTRAEDGCILYELSQNNADPTDFTFIEEWTTDAALDTHLQSEHIRTFQSKADELLTTAPDIRRYTLVA
ncbi:MAG: putative quinol monooxygenase [Acidobacteriota bacterium]